VSYRHLFETRASPVAYELVLAAKGPVNRAFHDARPASAGSVGLARGVLSRALRSSHASGIPVAPRPMVAALSRVRQSPVCQDRSLRPSVKMRRIRRPGIPSLAKAATFSLTAPSPSAFAVTKEPLARLRPHASSRSRYSRDTSTRACTSLAAVQRLLQLHFRRADTLSSTRFSRHFDRAHFAPRSNVPSCSADRYRTADLPLSKKDCEGRES